MRHNITINFHDILKIALRSDSRSYEKYFMAELPLTFLSKEEGTSPDIEVFIGKDMPPAGAGDICIKGQFKKIYRYRCVIKDILNKTIKVYFAGPAWGSALPMSLDAVFFHNQILDPLIYYKMLTKNMLMLHASAVGQGGKVYLFSGASGAGKTSLAFRFLNIGYRFLGDDVIFVSSNKNAFSYPKRVHYFSYLKKKNPFLRLPAVTAVSAGFREAIRCILSIVLKENFYLSTRVPVNRLFPSALYMDKGPLDTIFLIKIDKNVNFDDVLLSSDARDFLLNIMLKGKQDIVYHIRDMENSIMNGILEKTKIVSAKLDEVKVA